MEEKIYIRNSKGELEPLTEKKFETEDLLQELIGQHPELLAGEQMRPSDPLRWVLVRREMPIEGWAVDHLLLDQHGRPTLVEVKRGENRENRRSVVGQMLDYAATATSVWSERSIREVFEETQDEPDAVISKLLGDDNEPDIDSFWERVATNLEANRLRLLFVADEIPAELERVVTFLNEQTRDTVEVLAVEVKQYPGQFGDAIVSRVIGRIETPAESRPGRRSPRLSRDEFLSRFRPDVRDGIKTLMEAAGRVTSSPNDIFRLRGVSLSIRGRCSLWERPLYLGLLWLPNESNGDGSFTFHAELSPGHDYPPELRSILEKWASLFDNDAFGAVYQSGTYLGRQLTADEFVANVDLVTERLCGVLSDVAEL